MGGGGPESEIGQESEITEIKIGVQGQKRYRLIKLVLILQYLVFSVSSLDKAVWLFFINCLQGVGWCFCDLGKGALFLKTLISLCVICK